jgi:hypothetical protein
MAQAARDLGVHGTVLRRWDRRVRPIRSKPSPVRADATGSGGERTPPTRGDQAQGRAGHVKKAVVGSAGVRNTYP